MKCLIQLVILVLLIAPSGALAIEGCGASAKAPTLLNELNQKTRVPASTPLKADEREARRGCCSHHGGVCGCTSSGSAQCCDGSPSPSCGC